MRRVAALAALALALATAGCTIYDHDSVGPDYRIYRITVENNTSETFDIYLDDDFLATVSGRAQVAADVRRGWHHLEAVDLEGVVRAERSIDLHADFVWVLER